jgi:DNA polymerase-1
MSSDKDLLQLVDKNIKYLVNKKGMSQIDVFDKDNFVEKVGISPFQIPDYKGLVGDPSDNLPGVLGIGDKGAIKLLNEYKTLKNIYASIENIKGKVKEKLIDSKDNAFLSYELAILNCNVDIPLSHHSYDYKAVDTPELAYFYQKYEMKRFLRELKSKPENPYNRLVF